jgi:hypothetical protein
MWQSIPYESEAGELRELPKPPNARPQGAAASSARLRFAHKMSKSAPAAGPSARPRRHPVAAATVSEQAPSVGPAARARELERRLDILAPGTKLGERMLDPDNPSWRRPRPGRINAESNSLSLPFDEKGASGFIAQGYHVQPDAQNPRGNTGATVGLRTRY